MKTRSGSKLQFVGAILVAVAVVGLAFNAVFARTLTEDEKIYGVDPFDAEYSLGYLTLGAAKFTTYDANTITIVEEEVESEDGEKTTLSYYTGKNTTKDADVWIGLADAAYYRGAKYDVVIYPWSEASTGWKISSSIRSFLGTASDGSIVSTDLEMHFYPSGSLASGTADDTTEAEFKGVARLTDIDCLPTADGCDSEKWTILNNYGGAWVAEKTHTTHAAGSNTWGSSTASSGTNTRTSVWLEVQGSSNNPLHLQFSSTTGGSGISAEYVPVTLSVPAGIGTSQIVNVVQYGMYSPDTVLLSAEVAAKYDFEGWYTDASYTTKVTEPLTVTDNTTLYAHFVEKPAQTEPQDNPSGNTSGSGSANNGGGENTNPSTPGNGSNTTPANPSQTPTYLQDFNAATMLKNEGDTATLTDRRDGKTYRVRRLVDGKVWMVDDLAFTKSMTLTSADSAVAQDTPIKFVNFDVDDRSNNLSANYYQDSQTGVLYNYYAATAGNSWYNDGMTEEKNVKSSICPAGWRLPTGGETGELAILYEDGYNDLTDIEGGEFKTNGYYIANPDLGLGLVTKVGGYWSSTVGYGSYNESPSTTAYGLRIEPAENSFIDVFPDDYWTKDSGLSIKCVANTSSADVPVSEDFAFFQDFDPTTELKNIGDTARLVDRRDGKSYNVRRLKDGKVWMLENLMFVRNMELTPKDSAVSQTTQITFVDDYDMNYVNQDNAIRTDMNGRYNFVAASAGTYDSPSKNSIYQNQVTSSICPAGWHLPTGGYDTGELDALYEAGNGDSKYLFTDKTGPELYDVSQIANATIIDNDGQNKAERSAYWWSEGGKIGGDSRGYWSSTVNEDNAAMANILDTTYYLGGEGLFVGTGGDDIYAGNYIRCVAGPIPTMAKAIVTEDTPEEIYYVVDSQAVAVPNTGYDTEPSRRSAQSGALQTVLQIALGVVGLAGVALIVASRHRKIRF